MGCRSSVEVRLERASDVDHLCLSKYDTVLIGPGCDDRGRHLAERVAANGVPTKQVTYCADSMSIKVDGKAIDYEDGISEEVLTGTEVLVDATTLGVAELVPVFAALRNGRISCLDIVYVEPSLYRRTSDSVVSRRDFEISRVRQKFQPIPGHSYVIRPNKHCVVIIAGFEGERIVHAFEEHPLEPKESTVVFGVPAYRAGWEMDSFANHVSELGDSGIKSRVQFCPADNPIATYRMLKKLYDGMPRSIRLFVAPLGTKPQAVGAASFLADHGDVGLLFDHPTTLKGRTVGVGCTHRFRYEVRG